MPRFCVYGTVYNNVGTVVRSISSVFDPSYEIVVTDNYSTDGTWEKLQELKKEFNLTLLRYRSSRGKGRDYALKHCPENSITAFFDLDDVYNENFHKILKSEISGVVAGTLVINKEEAVKKGGWRDLNAGEDWEFKLRVGFKYSIPVLIGKDQQVAGLREARYAKNMISLLHRLLRKYIDLTRALNYSIRDVMILYKGKYKLLAFLLYPLPLVLGKYSYEKGTNNLILYFNRWILKLRNPKDLGLQISDDYIVLTYPKVFQIFRHNKYSVKVEEFENIIENKLGKMYKFNYNNNLIYAKNEKAFRDALEGLYFS